MAEPSKISQKTYRAFDHSEVCLDDCKKITVRKKTKVANVNDLVCLGAPKLAQVFYNALRVGPRVVLSSVFEFLRANVITRILSALVLISIDTVRFLRGRVSRKQYFIDVALALTLLVSGTAGWFIGSNFIGMFLESMVLGIAAGIVGAGVLGAVIGGVCEKTISRFVQGDTADMLEICNDTLAELAAEYKLNEDEVCECAEAAAIDPKTVSEMFLQKDRAEYARKTIEPCVKNVIEKKRA
jgi:hypothetical protein